MTEPNPYEAPRERPSTWIGDPSLIELSEQEVNAFVGRKASFYLRKWPLSRESLGTSSGFNWGAFFFAGLWLGYRRMYRVAIIFFSIVLFESILEWVVFIGILGKDDSPPGLNEFVGLVCAIVCGFLGNGWYLSHTKRVVAEVRSQELGEDAYYQELSKRGGTRLGAALGLFALFVVALFASLFLLEVVFVGA